MQIDLRIHPKTKNVIPAKNAIHIHIHIHTKKCWKCTYTYTFTTRKRWLGIPRILYMIYIWSLSVHRHVFYITWYIGINIEQYMYIHKLYIHMYMHTKHLKIPLHKYTSTLQGWASGQRADEIQGPTFHILWFISYCVYVYAVYIYIIILQI